MSAERALFQKSKRKRSSQTNVALKANSLEQQSKENVLARPFKQFAYWFSPERLILNKEQFAHIVDAKTGKITLVEGPIRRVLRYDERIDDTYSVAGVKKPIKYKIVVPENSFVVITNPFKDGEIQYGEREVRIGPKTFSLHPGEQLTTQVHSEYVLTQYDAVFVRVLQGFDDYHAGDEYLIKGPRTYIPSKYEQVIRTVKAISLSDTDGIYVQNQDTGDVTTVRGPVDYFLKPNEKRYKKELTDDELAGVGLQPQNSKDIRVLTRQAANTSFLYDHSNALVLELEEKEVVLLYDGSESRIEIGPKTVFVGPYERPKILTLSGGKPIRPGVLKVGLLKLGPDFIYDRIKVRTKDNAQIIVDVTYKWRFKTDRDLKDAFSIDDFVGYAAETLSSDIRSVVAKHNFEDLHASALQYAKEAIFGDAKARVFEENGLEIFGIDITAIVPEDPNIAEKLHEAIKHNMDVYCKKIVLQATLEAERQEVEGKKRIEAERGDLIKAESENYHKKIIERAKSDAEEARIHAESNAEATRIKGRAEIEQEQQRLETVIRALNEDGASVFVELEKARTFQNAKKLVVVPTKSKIVLPYDKQEDIEEDDEI